MLIFDRYRPAIRYCVSAGKICDCCEPSTVFGHANRETRDGCHPATVRRIGFAPSRFGYFEPSSKYSLSSLIVFVAAIEEGPGSDPTVQEMNRRTRLKPALGPPFQSDDRGSAKRAIPGYRRSGRYTRDRNARYSVEISRKIRHALDEAKGNAAALSRESRAKQNARITPLISSRS